MKVRVSQLMVPINEFPTISEDDHIYRAAESLVDAYKERDNTWRGYESLHVVDSFKNSTGILTFRSLLKLLNPHFKFLRRNILRGKKTGGTIILVKDIMRTLSSDFVGVNDEMEKAVRIIMQKKINSVMVCSDGKLVGIVRAIDLFWFADEIL